MIWPLIGARVHGWLDDAVVLTYLIGAYVLKLRGPAMSIALAGALVHFFLARFTAYPQGYVKLVPLRVHAWMELCEGIGVLVATWLIVPRTGTLTPHVFLTMLGASQLVAFVFSDYRLPSGQR